MREKDGFSMLPPFRVGTVIEINFFAPAPPDLLMKRIPLAIDVSMAIQMAPG
jgi:hypothetical protein